MSYVLRYCTEYSEFVRRLRFLGYESMVLVPLINLTPFVFSHLLDFRINLNKNI